MKNKCIISFIKWVECNYSEETHKKIEKGKQINKRYTSNALHSLRGSALHTLAPLHKTFCHKKTLAKSFMQRGPGSAFVGN